MITVYHTIGLTSSEVSGSTYEDCLHEVESLALKCNQHQFRVYYGGPVPRTYSLYDGKFREIAICPKCSSELSKGKAIAQTYTGIPDFASDGHVCTISPGGPGKLVDCLKCHTCGWSRSL